MQGLENGDVLSFCFTPMLPNSYNSWGWTRISQELGNPHKSPTWLAALKQNSQDWSWLSDVATSFTSKDLTLSHNSSSVFFFFKMCLFLFGSQSFITKENQRQSASIRWLSPPMAAMARVGLAYTTRNLIWNLSLERQGPEHSGRFYRPVRASSMELH